MRDFPADEVLIDGLHAMQMHFEQTGVGISIPVVRVMNTAHLLAAYMFATTCSGDQMEYDCMADMNLSRDRKLFKMTIIVLAAMLARTEGFRARQCRNMLLANRDADFDEGVTLYDRFLRSAEEHFAEEDFLIDTHTQIQKLIAENEQLVMENKRLRYSITIMEKRENNQYNISYNAPVYNGCSFHDSHDTNNQYYATPSNELSDVKVSKGASEHSESSQKSKEEIGRQKMLPFVVVEKLTELGMYSLEEFEAMYREAASSGAPKLAKFLKRYIELKVLKVDGYNKKEIFEELKMFFGEEIKFGYPNFVAYY